MLSAAASWKSGSLVSKVMADPAASGWAMRGVGVLEGCVDLVGDGVLLDSVAVWAVRVAARVRKRREAAAVWSMKGTVDALTLADGS